jgi:hypothetical protein
VPWFGADGQPNGLVADLNGTLVRVAPGAPCRIGPWTGSTVDALADLDADGTIDVIGTSTCAGCTSNQVFGRGVR